MLNITQNGFPAASIVLSPTASELERYAAEELHYHVKKVSGAALPTVNGKAEGISIIIGTPDSLSQLNQLFSEDVKWLTTLWDDSGKRWCSDGFAIRTVGEAIYIFGTTPRGAINGVYDFIEKNLGVLWLRTDVEHGTVYEKMPTIAVIHDNYREKSPFEVRGWHLCANNRDYRSELMIMRNKLNAMSLPIPSSSVTKEDDPVKYAVRLGMKRQAVTHNLKSLVQNSPVYDPDCDEYRNTDDEGNRLSWEDCEQVNFFSDRTVDAVAASLIKQLDTSEDNVVFIGIEDYSLPGRCFPEDTMPFEYAPGKFVYPQNKPYIRVDYCSGKRVAPEDEDYIATVWFTFINKIARKVKKAHPCAIIQTFAYFFTENPPLCPLEDNVHLVFAPLTEEDLSAHYYETDNIHSARLLREFDAWSKLTPNIVFYNYYGCFKPSHMFERAIWSKLQSDLRYYAKCNFTGLIPEGLADCKGYNTCAPEDPNGGSSAWDMNALTFWIYGKLTWNPDADIPSLIVEFCDKYYGGASEHMQEYYRLLEMGWNQGRKKSVRLCFDPEPASYYMDTFVGDWNLAEPILTTLRHAWDAANDVEKTRIRRIKEVYEDYFANK
ncbi:MAG: DUF4838 domain-containing protein [Ruminococcaceae bacterium]|nr:DUF4838 domain-containing protein [Oscillospiraceae bacterium]